MQVSNIESVNVSYSLRSCRLTASCTQPNAALLYRLVNDVLVELAPLFDKTLFR